MKSIIFH